MFFLKAIAFFRTYHVIPHVDVLTPGSVQTLLRYSILMSVDMWCVFQYSDELTQGKALKKHSFFFSPSTTPKIDELETFILLLFY